MKKVTYEIQQHTGYQFEPVPNGDFETADGAIAGMNELESELEWRDLRVIEVIRTDGAITHGDVIAVGSPSDEDDEE